MTVLSRCVSILMKCGKEEPTVYPLDHLYSNTLHCHLRRYLPKQIYLMSIDVFQIDGVNYQVDGHDLPVWQIEDCLSYRELLWLLELPLGALSPVPSISTEEMVRAREVNRFRALPVYHEILAACNAVTKSAIAKYLVEYHKRYPTTDVKNVYVFWYQTPKFASAVKIPQDVMREYRDILCAKLGWPVEIKYYDSSWDGAVNPTDSQLGICFD